jgi:hypothetical protein
MGLAMVTTITGPPVHFHLGKNGGAIDSLHFFDGLLDVALAR